LNLYKLALELGHNIEIIVKSKNMKLNTDVNSLTALELAQVLVDRLSISPNDWHRLKANRKARASEQAAAALVFLLKDKPDEAVTRFQQAISWLNLSISASPCPHHSDRDKKTLNN